MQSAVSKENLNRVLQNLRSSQKSMNKCSLCKAPITFEEVQRSSSQNLPLFCKTHLEKHHHDTLNARKLHLITHIQDILSRKGVPPRYINCSFSNFKVPPGRASALTSARTVATSPLHSQGIFLTGPNGTGKTHLAVSILRQTLLRYTDSCRFIKIPLLLFEVKQAFKSNSYDSEDLLIKRFLNYDLLVLDEIGVEKATPWALQTLYLIIDGRSTHLKKTVFTSNLTLQDIEDNLDARFASRIVEMCKVVKVDGPDYRLSSKTKKLKGAKD